MDSRQYLIYEKSNTTENCRFCKNKTTMRIRLPESLMTTPVCPPCKDTKWKRKKLGELFNRDLVFYIVEKEDLPVIDPKEQLLFNLPTDFNESLSMSQLIFNELEDWWIEPLYSGLRLFAYIQSEEIRFLTTYYNFKINVHTDITDQLSHLQLTLPELNGTVLDGILISDEFNKKFSHYKIRDILKEIEPCKFIVTDCLKYSKLDIRILPLHMREVSIANAFKIIGVRDFWEKAPIQVATSWTMLRNLLNTSTAGLMLKNRKYPYYSLWIKWRKSNA
jgi:ATP-dependent DNA ligase